MGVGGILYQITSPIVLTSKRTVWAIKPSVQLFDFGARSRKVRTGQNSHKVTKWQYSSICGEAPTVPTETEICIVYIGSLFDVLGCAKFSDEIFMSYDFTGGRRSHFLIDVCTNITTVERNSLLHCLWYATITVYVMYAPLTFKFLDAKKVDGDGHGLQSLTNGCR